MDIDNSWEGFMLWVYKEHRDGYAENIEKITINAERAELEDMFRKVLLKNVWDLLQNRG